MVNYLGINALNHEASVSVIRSDGEILFASMSERYSKKKNDTLLDKELMRYVLEKYYPQKLFWYENPLATNFRKRITGERINEIPKKYLKQFTNLDPIYTNHHRAHAASGFSTSKFNDACVLVVDSVGEFTSTSVWHASFDGKKCRYKLLKRYYYPNSLGLFYSYFTRVVGFKPNEEEYIMMGLSSYGTDILVEEMENRFIDTEKYMLKEYLHHKGDCFLEKYPKDIAFAAQVCFEKSLEGLLRSITSVSDNLVYVGGCALNCLANRLISKYFDNIWILPNPGDGGLSLGSVASSLNMKLNWDTIFLGENVPGDYPVQEAVQILLNEGIVGVCNGRAEFGPRALGNRSLFADPRKLDIKDIVNKIKERQLFRPFAAVIKIERYKDYFEDIVDESPYMQYALKLKDPLQYPSISHIDGTCRVQTVSKDSHLGLWNLLDLWEKKTNCPMLLNTSLNIKGMPMINDKKDALLFAKRYSVKVI